MDLKKDFQAAIIIHIALVIGQILIALILVFIQSDNAAPKNDLVLVIVAVFVSVGTMFLSPLLYNKVLEERRVTAQKEDLAGKLEMYRATKILRWAMLEGGNLMLILVYFLTGNALLLPLFVVSLGMMILARPSIEDFSDAFKLSAQEESKLRKALR